MFVTVSPYMNGIMPVAILCSLVCSNELVVVE